MYMTMILFKHSCSVYSSMIRTRWHKKKAVKTSHMGGLCLHTYTHTFRWKGDMWHLSNLMWKKNNNQNTFTSEEFSKFEKFYPLKNVLKLFGKNQFKASAGFELTTYRFIVNGIYFKIRKFILNLLSILLNNCFCFPVDMRLNCKYVH